MTTPTVSITLTAVEADAFLFYAGYVEEYFTENEPDVFWPEADAEGRGTWITERPPLTPGFDSHAPNERDPGRYSFKVLPEFIREAKYRLTDFAPDTINGNNRFADERNGGCDPFTNKPITEEMRQRDRDTLKACKSVWRKMAKAIRAIGCDPDAHPEEDEGDEGDET